MNMGKRLLGFSAMCVTNTISPFINDNRKLVAWYPLPAINAGVWISGLIALFSGNFKSLKFTIPVLLVLDSYDMIKTEMQKKKIFF
jgi:hypothetical protein